MAKKKSSERTLMWVFGIVAVVALLGVVALALGDGVTGLARWTSPVFGTKTGIFQEPVKSAPVGSVIKVCVVYDNPDGTEGQECDTFSAAGEKWRKVIIAPST